MEKSFGKILLKFNYGATTQEDKEMKKILLNVTESVFNVNIIFKTKEKETIKKSDWKKMQSSFKELISIM